MDERKVAQLFRDAASDAPPPSFDLDDVAAASARAGARHRSAVLAGSALGVAVLVGGAVVGTELLRGGGEEGSTATLAGPESSTKHRMEQNAPGNPRSGPAADDPTNSPKQGGDKSGRVGPRTDGTPRGCNQVDRELAVALAGELPATPSPSDADTGNLRCPDGGRSAGFQVRGDGTVSVLLLPPGVAVGQPWSGAVPNAEHVRRAAQRGGTVIVLSEPGSGQTEAPQAARLPEIARSLAARF